MLLKMAASMVGRGRWQFAIRSLQESPAPAAASEISSSARSARPRRQRTCCARNMKPYGAARCPLRILKLLIARKCKRKGRPRFVSQAAAFAALRFHLEYCRFLRLTVCSRNFTICRPCRVADISADGCRAGSPKIHSRMRPTSRTCSQEGTRYFRFPACVRTRISSRPKPALPRRTPGPGSCCGYATCC
ncbi:hypothetical protein GALL_509170 [mine drainage metagenome]|uniref:Uncharacterized protein n=1 Tax=mine drainage metagenome TaxID=410659 RepID=A0A1J5PV93_9ZZZZ